jgi:hypothetical protein
VRARWLFLAAVQTATSSLSSRVSTVVLSPEIELPFPFKIFQQYFYLVHNIFFHNKLTVLHKLVEDVSKLAAVFRCGEVNLVAASWTWGHRQGPGQKGATQ